MKKSFARAIYIVGSNGPPWCTGDLACSRRMYVTNICEYCYDSVELLLCSAILLLDETGSDFLHFRHFCRGFSFLSAFLLEGLESMIDLSCCSSNLIYSILFFYSIDINYKNIIMKFELWEFSIDSNKLSRTCCS